MFATMQKERKLLFILIHKKRGKYLNRMGKKRKSFQFQNISRGSQLSVETTSLPESREWSLGKAYGHNRPTSLGMAAMGTPTWTGTGMSPGTLAEPPVPSLTEAVCSRQGFCTSSSGAVVLGLRSAPCTRCTHTCEC